MFASDAFAAESFSALPDGTVTGSVYASEFVDNASSDGEVSSLAAFLGTVSNGGAIADIDFAARVFLASVFENLAVAQTDTAGSTNFAALVNEAAKVERVERYVGFGFATGGFASGSFAGLGDGTSFYGGSVFSANIEVSYAFSEGVTATDQRAASVIFPASFDAAAAVSDEVGAIPEYPGVLSEGATAEEVVSSIPTYLVRIEEVTTASTTAFTLVELRSIVSEVVIGTETPTSLFIVNAAVTDAVVQTDRPFAQYVTRPVVVNMAQATDTTEARLQWENINTFETTNWKLINTIE